MIKEGNKIHLAGYYNGKASAYTIEDYPYFLESYHYINNERLVNMIRQDKRKIFLDSGAFSAFTQNVTIDIKGYAEFIKRNQDIITVASVLDGIGDPELTLTNQKKLEDMDVNILPCFHYGEDIKYLEYYLEKYDHITLGGMVPISTPQLKVWLDELWGKYLTDDKGMPKVKVHGFGLTVISLITRYPWYSVDSTSWVLTGRFGAIYWPTNSRLENKLVLSEQSPKTKELGKHYDNLSVIEKEEVKRKIEEKGFTIDELRTIYWKRDLWNIDYFYKLCDTPIKPFKQLEVGLFDA